MIHTPSPCNESGEDSSIPQAENIELAPLYPASDFEQENRTATEKQECKEGPTNL